MPEHVEGAALYYILYYIILDYKNECRAQIHINLYDIILYDIVLYYYNTRHLPIGVGKYNIII